jgi:hypothetical protein
MYKPILRSLKTHGYFWKRINHEIKNNNNTKKIINTTISSESTQNTAKLV